MELKTKYLNMSTKRELCEMVVRNSLLEKDGLIFIDYISLGLALDLSLIQFYSNINLDEEDYEKLAESGKLEELKSCIPESEFYFIKKTIDNMLHQEVEVHNSLAGVINRQLSNLINKLPTEKEMSKLLKNLPKALDKVSPETIQILKDLNMNVGKVK